MDIIIGRNTVREAIRAGRTIEAVLVTRGGMDGSLCELVTLARQRGIVVKEVPRERLDQLAMPFGYHGRPGNHQGIAAEVSNVRYAELEDVFEYAQQKGEAPFIVALDGITDEQNLGAIVRSAEVLGAHGVVVPKRRSASMSAVACKVASGAEEYIPIVRVTNLAATIDQVKERGVWVAAADMSGQSAWQTDLTGPLMLVIGAEGDGVSRIVKERSDYVVKIEQKGKIDSMNAAAAAAVLMYEKQRQEVSGASK